MMACGIGSGFFDILRASGVSGKLMTSNEALRALRTCRIGSWVYGVGPRGLRLHRQRVAFRRTPRLAGDLRDGVPDAQDACAQRPCWSP